MRFLAIIMLAFLQFQFASTTLKQAVLEQVIRAAEENEFESPIKCDLLFLSDPTTLLVSLEDMTRPLLYLESTLKAPMVSSTCIILIITVPQGNANLTILNTLLSGMSRNYLVITVVNQIGKAEKTWGGYGQNFIQRNMLEIVTKEVEKVAVASVFCAQNSGHLWKYSTHIWSLQSSYEKMTYLTPRQLCPHPLFNQKFNAGYIVAIPNIYPNKSAKSGVVGFEVQLLQLIQGKFGFEPSFVKVAGGEYNPETGVSNGRIGMVAKGQLDGGMGACTARHPLQKIMDFTHFFYNSDYKWFTRKPVPKAKYDQFLIAFSPGVWIAVLLTYTILSIVFALLYHMYQLEPFRRFKLTGHLTHPADFFLITFTSMVEANPIPWYPKFSAGKLLIMVWSLFSLNMSAFYISNLRSDLTRKNYEKPVDTSADVVQRDKKVYLPVVTYNAFFKNQKIDNPDLARVMSMVVEKNGLYDMNINGNFTIDEFKREMLGKGAVGASYTLSMRSLYRMSGGDANLTMDKFRGSRETFYNFYSTFQVRKDAIWINDFDRIIGAFDMGIVDHLVNMQFLPERSSSKKDSSTEDTNPISLDQVLSALFLLAFGLSVAIVTFSLELLLFNRDSKTELELHHFSFAKD